MRKLLLPLLILLILLFGAIGGYAAPAPLVISAGMDGVVGTVLETFLGEILEEARQREAELVVIKLDTPGGLVSSMRSMTSSIINSPVPVAVWVGPSGARAASAGAFLVQSGHIAAMASGTNIGAAHPVSAGGDIEDSEMNRKITNDLAAQMRSLADQRQRNAEMAERMVTKSISLTSREALEAGVVDLLAEDMEELLAAADGRTVFMGREEVRLDLDGYVLEEREMSGRMRALHFISRPDIAYLFLLAGIYAIVFEILSPGGFVLGVSGAVMVLMGAYGLRMLPFNWAGIILLLAGVAVMILDLLVGGIGILSLFGTAALIVGGLIVYRAPGGELLNVSMGVVGGAIVALTVFFLIAATAVWRSMRRHVESGGEGLVGMVVQTRSVLEPEGMVLCHGELWRGRVEEGLRVEKGRPVQIIRVEGLVLIVEPIGAGEPVPPNGKAGTEAAGEDSREGD